MPKLEAFLLTWVEDLLPITKYFPLGYANKKNLAELVIVTRSFLQCGKGTLQHKNKLFFYRTYIPSNTCEATSSKKSSFSDFFSNSDNPNNKKVFILFLCDINYKKKDIDSLTKQIYEILDKDAFDKQDLKKETSRRINFLYEQYQNLESNNTKYIQLSDINTNEIKTEINNNINNNNEYNSLDTDNDNNNIINRTGTSRIIWSKIDRSKSNLGSIDINDLTTIKENDSDLSIIFKQNLDENLNLSQMKKMKTIKKVNIILCSVLFVISLTLIILLFVKGR